METARAGNVVVLCRPKSEEDDGLPSAAPDKP